MNYEEMLDRAKAQAAVQIDNYPSMGDADIVHILVKMGNDPAAAAEAVREVRDLEEPEEPANAWGERLSGVKALARAAGLLAALLATGCMQSTYLEVPPDPCDAGQWSACYVGWNATQAAQARHGELGCEGPAPELYVVEQLDRLPDALDVSWAVSEYARLGLATECEALYLEPDMRMAGQ